MEKKAVTIKEAALILGLSSRGELYRVLDAGNVLQVVERDGKRLILREGLEEAWHNRPRRRVQAATSKEGKESRAQARRPAPPPPTVDDWPIPPGDDCPGLPAIPATTPNLEDERAWVEFERRYKIKRENMTEDGKLVYKDDIVKAMSAVLSALLNRAHGVARQVRLQLPHLTGEDMVVMDKIFLSIFEEVSSLDYENLRL